jgi:hypothetical protein
MWNEKAPDVILCFIRKIFMKLYHALKIRIFLPIQGLKVKNIFVFLQIFKQSKVRFDFVANAKNLFS